MSNLSPLDEDGKPIDWWFLYKVPEITKSSSLTSVAKGYEYVYYDAHAGLVNPTNILTSGKGALDLTLASLFKGGAATTGWILYNDETPASANTRDNGQLGHTKGVLAFDTATKTGFWLLHSWPKFADPKATGVDLPTPKFGQTFLCVALDLATISKIAAQMANHQEPQTFECKIPASIAKDDPIRALSEPLAAGSPGACDAVDYRTRGGLAFKVIAKNRKWGRDFWNDLVGPTLSEDLDVETWIRGAIPPNQDSDGVHSVADIKYIDLRPLGAPWAWPETKDHAKWGITGKDNWVCVGDINRMITQEKRGGGTIAFQDAKLWALLHQTDLLVLPTGMSADKALDLIHGTHAKPRRSDVRTVAAPTATNGAKSVVKPGALSKAKAAPPKGAEKRK